MDGEMSLLDRLRTDRPSSRARGRGTRWSRSATAQGRLAARFDLAREHAIRSHEPQGWLGGVLIGAWSALLSLLAVALPMLLVWATSSTPATWGQAARTATQAWLLVHGVALQVPGGRLHLLPLALVALPLWLCWRAGRRVGASAPRLANLSPTCALRSLGTSVAGLVGGYTVVLLAAALLARGSGVRPMWWHAVVAGVAIAGPAAAAAAVWVALAAAQSQPARRGARSIVADWCQVPARLRRTVRPAMLGVACLLGFGAVLVAAAVVAQHQRVLGVHEALAPGGLGSVVLVLGQLAYGPDLAVWAVAWCAGPGFAVGVGTAVTPAASTLGLLPLVPVLGALPTPGPMPAPWQAAVLLPVLVGVVVGWRCTRGLPPSADGDLPRPTLSAVLDALVAAALATSVLTVLVLASSGSAGPGRLSDVGPSAWRVGLALLVELGAGAAAAAWVGARRSSWSEVGAT
jgi:hypothetical protein